MCSEVECLAGVKWSGLCFGGGGAGLRAPMRRGRRSAEGVPSLAMMSAEVGRRQRQQPAVFTQDAVVGSELGQRRYRLLRPRTTTRMARDSGGGGGVLVGDVVGHDFACVQLPKHRLVPAPCLRVQLTPLHQKSIKVLAPVPSPAQPTTPSSIKSHPPPSIRLLQGTPRAAHLKLPDLPSIPSLWLP